MYIYNVVFCTYQISHFSDLASALILRKISEKSCGQCNIVGATFSLREGLQKYFIKAILFNIIFS